MSNEQLTAEQVIQRTIDYLRASIRSKYQEIDKLKAEADGLQHALTALESWNSKRGSQ